MRKLDWPSMGGWYWIGVAVGLGVAIGVLLAGVLAGTRAALAGALLVAVAAGLGVGLVIGGWGEAIGGAIGGALGAIGSAPVAAGSLRRGGGRFGTAVLVGVAALAIAALAWVPVVGYLEAVFVPAFAARLRRRAPERYAGLRSLARD
jgi:hypothetical protein